MKIIFATDHAGFELKNVLVEYVKTLGFEVEDCGAKFFDKEDDYPDFITLAAKAVSLDPTNPKAIVLGGSGQGEAIVSNRFSGVRAVVYYGKNLEIIKLSREHNDANILSLGARFLSSDEAKEAVKLWLETPFSYEERHLRRIQKIEQIN
ncbi:RpiB/LacA/LacB family sugar-phosphate isomerase [Patescibacteria group bacterium]|nr:MAG: RpiB/LacA/LacB family sugar-phosphate isomerase [Patescibacteria group bacterium]